MSPEKNKDGFKLPEKKSTESLIAAKKQLEK